VIICTNSDACIDYLSQLLILINDSDNNDNNNNINDDINDDNNDIN
jgi:hypothetical protein